MIISASRRTDIPSFYSVWFFNRLREGYVLVRNPVNACQISRISLSPEVVDGIVFWTKNPYPMLQRLEELEKYPYYFQFTVTPYGPDVETNLPAKDRVIIPAFQELSGRIGKERVIWRYDPVFFNETYTLEYHDRCFEKLASRLAPYTEKCVVSFIDFYRNMKRNAGTLQMRQVTALEQFGLLKRMAQTAQKYGIRIETCAEKGDFGSLGIQHGHCIEKSLLERIGNYKLNVKKDRNQRKECGCVESMDIGAYNTCPNGCLYCYANHSNTGVKSSFEKHDPNSPLLFGEVREGDIVKEREARSLIERQMSLF